VGRLWTCGVDVDLATVTGTGGRRVSLPGYPFQRRRYWIEPRRDGSATVGALTGPATGEEQDEAAPPAAGSGVDERPALSVPYVEPRDDRERRIAAIWSDLLGVAPVGVHDPFLELGGHSLLATRVVDRIRAAFRTRVPVRRILETPTVAGLAAVVAEVEESLGLADGADGADELPKAEPDPAGLHEPFPLAEIQQAQWLGRLGSLEGGNTAAHVYWEVDAAEVDLARLEDAWQRVLDRHPMLRAVVTPDGRQRILPDVSRYRIGVLDLRAASPEEAEGRLAELREALSHEMRPADAWPLFDLRATLLPGGSTRLHLGVDLLIADIGSIRLLVADWGRFYRDPGARPEPVGLSYRDYVLAVERLRGTPLHQRSLDYWRQRIAELPPRPDLPLAAAPATVTEPEFVARDVVVGTEQWRRIVARAAAHGLTPSAVMLAVYATTLGRWCRSGRFTVNVTVTNRLQVHPDVGRLVGEFASFDLLPVDLAGTGGVLGLARSLQEQSWHDLEHRYVSGVEILREMARARGGAAGAVMPVVFTSTLVQENEPGQESLFGWLGEMVHEIAQTPQVWVDAALMEVAGGVKLSWHAVRQLFPAGVLDEMFAAFAALVASLAADEQAWTREQPVPLPAAQQALVAAANDTAGPAPDGLLVDGLLGWARREPDRPAVLAPDRALSYGELVGHASRLGRALREGGVRPGELVAVAAPKTAEQVVAAVAVQLAGAAYLPVDPDLPVERQDHLVAVGGCRWVLTRSGEPERAWPDAVSVLAVDLAAEPAEPLVPVQGPDDLAYVIFTSGSTGTPKGVVLTHRAALNTLDDVSERFGVGPDDAVLGLSSLSFDLSVYDVFGVLGAGGRLVLPPPGSGRDPDRWAALVAEHGITVWNSVPALAQMLVDAEAARPEPTGALAGLRVALLSGDWIPVTLPDRLRALAPGCAVISLGGATEAAVWSIAHPVGEVDPDRDSIPYGRPLRNQTFHVLDDRWQECPVWTPGELFIGGVGLALGYWRDEERTAAAFVTSPVTGERLYRTGDLGRWLPDGTIEFLGREDFQVKVGGYRIELGEIESALAGCPGVDAVVVAAHGDRHHRRLVGYLVPAADADPERLAADARAVAERTLPAYMVPGAFVTLPRLPLSPNGKVDRGALPDPAQERDPAGVPAAAAGPTAAALAEVVGELLGVAEVGLHDNFFAIGGDSISGIQVVGRANALGLDLTPADLFRHQTIAELAAAVDARRPPAAGADAGLPRTPYQAFAGPAPGVHGVELPVPDGVCADGVDAAVRAVLARHPALRARLVPRPAGEGGPAGAGQEIAPLDPAAGAPLVELGVLPAARRPAALAGMVADMAAELDAAAGPTVQATLFDLGDGGRRLALVGCDSVADTRSWPLLVADLRAALAVAAGGDAPRLPPEVTPYPVWAGRLDPTAGTGGEPAADADPATARPDAPTGAVLAVPVDLAGATGLLAGAAAAYRLTAEETGLAVLAAALRRRDDRPALAVEADLRADAVPGLDATGTVGPLAAVLPVRLDSWPAGLGELISAVKEARRSAAPGPVRPGVLLRHAGDLAAGTPGGPAAPLPSPHLLAVGGPELTVTTGCAGGDLVAQVCGADGAAVEALAGALAAAAAELAEHCRHPDSGGVSASDFPFAGLDTDAMGAFLAAVTRQ
jgi:amino acid adenylation domain-containing protein